MKKKEINKIVENERMCYLIKVIPSITKSEEIILFADQVIIEAGVLTFVVEDDNSSVPVLSLAPTYWKYFYVVDPDNFSCIGVHRWQGVTGIQHILDQEMVDNAVKKALTESENFNTLVEYFIEAAKIREEEIAIAATIPEETETIVEPENKPE